MRYILFYMDFEYPENVRQQNFKVFDSKEEAVNSDMFLDIDEEKPIILSEEQKQKILSSGWLDTEDWAIHLMELPDNIPSGSMLRWTKEPCNSKPKKDVAPAKTFNITGGANGLIIEEKT